MIEIRDISKTHKGQQVLSDIDISVGEGTNLGLIGPGGAGKSLLLKIVTGLVEPDAGTVTIWGEDVHELSETELAKLHADIGMLFQNYALFDSMTVFGNIAFPLRRDGDLTKTEIDARVNELLEMIDLPGIGGQYPNELSGGMKKRVSFARAVVQKPPLVFYDDPGAGLDPVTSSKIFRLLEQMKESRGTTSITVSHDLAGMKDICDEFAMLHDGELRLVGDRDAFETTDSEIVKRFWQGGIKAPLKEGRI
jgi:phospholipid/cholesterol/gamma-HCH transport system ATP-binding protein